ncbi:MAG: glutamate--cysteine ligase [gamma proteobacterium symbiont of Taylorina sp.]|nr:glutamate--cysteine ligase [gamma proteobacterium symbiont of Taylorina sp.]
MGQEITHRHFKKNDFSCFRDKMDAELQWLSHWFEQETQKISQQNHYHKCDTHPSIGFELETCFIDQNAEPACINNEFLQRLKHSSIFPQVTTELAQFNIELNSSVFVLSGSVLHNMEQELTRLWSECETVANELGCCQIMVGSLPSLQEQHLQLANMSHLTRYKALNEQVLRSRKGRAIELDIQGSETLKSVHQDVMLESAATSFQLHLQMPFSQSVRYYNAAILLSAPIVALTANSPFLFAKDLWCETRIPVFEQAVSVGGFDGAMFGPVKRVSFGSGYAKQSLLECFQENNEHFPVLLPEIFNTAVEDLAHLSLHNGTIWRWNRPLIAYREDPERGRDYHVRLEHRVMPSGPTIIDSVANAAFFIGAVTALANQYEIAELQLPFVQAKENFYRAAKQGLHGKTSWLSGRHLPMKALLMDYLLPMAKDGLNQLGIARQDIAYYLGIIEQRISSGQNGAVWQRRYVENYGKDMQALTRAYLQMQQSGRAVHEWEV